MSFIVNSVTTPYLNTPFYSDPVLPIPVLSAVNTFISPTALNPINPAPLINPYYVVGNSLPGPYVAYKNVNSDVNLRKSTVKYFWQKVLRWVKYSSSYADLYEYLVVKGDKVMIAKDVTQKNNEAEHNLKYNFIIEEVIEKSDLYKILDKFCSINAVNWWDLQKDGVSDKVKIYIRYRIKDYLKHNLEK